MKTFMEGRIQVTTGDITRLEVDAVVNAANSSLLGGGGVDGAIHRAGGPAILEECKKIRAEHYPGGLPAGEAVITSGGKLPAKHVIHTVGPVWHGGNDKEEETLANAYGNSLQLAGQKGIQSIAFPAISTGVYGFPKEKAAKIAFSAISSYLESNEFPAKVVLIFFEQKDMDSFIGAVE